MHVWLYTDTSWKFLHSKPPTPIPTPFPFFQLTNDTQVRKSITQNINLTPKLYNRLSSINIKPKYVLSITFKRIIYSLIYWKTEGKSSTRFYECNIDKMYYVVGTFIEVR